MRTEAEIRSKIAHYRQRQESAGREEDRIEAYGIANELEWVLGGHSYTVGYKEPEEQ